MTTPALTAESEARLETWAGHLTPDYLDFLRETLVIAEAAAVARHVRETRSDDGLTAESEALIADYHGRMHEDDCECDAAFIRDPLRAIEAAAVARHVRETGCDALDRLRPLIEDSDCLSLALRVDGRWQAMLWFNEDPTAEADGATMGEALAALAPSPATEAERRGGEG